MTLIVPWLARSESEPPDITFASPTRPKPPVPVTATMRRRNPKIARDGLVALVALVVVVFALLPMSSRAVRPSIHPSSPVVNAVTPQTHAVTPTKVLSAPVVRIHRGDTLWASAERTRRATRRGP